MDSFCKNCNSQLIGNYCHECGQAAKTAKFNLKYLIIGLLDTIELERGVIPGFLKLVYTPGRAIRQYIQGKRVGFYSPLKLFLITGAIATYLTFEYSIFNQEDEGLLDVFNLTDMDGYVYYSGKYFSFFSLTGIPIFALVSWLIFYKSRYNYIENLVMNIYLAAGQFLIVLIYAPIMINWDNVLVDSIYGLLNFGYNLWVLIVFFEVRKLIGFIKVIAAVFIPALMVFFVNYLLYRLAPTEFWQFLDLTFG